jgi:hypothetical protein
MVNIFREITIETTNFIWKMDDNGDWTFDRKLGSHSPDTSQAAINELLGAIGDDRRLI